MKPPCSRTTDAGSKHLEEIHVPSLSLEPMRGLLDRDETVRLDRDIESACKLLAGRVVWNINSTAVGGGWVNEYVARGWDFLRPFVADADAYVFSRHAYVPPGLDDRAAVIPPSIDPFSPKNQDLAPEVVRAILQHVGLVGGEKGAAA